MGNAVPFVLCVCSGNIGRSPIMAQKLRQLFREHGMEGRVLVDSAGIRGTGFDDKTGKPSVAPNPRKLSDWKEGDIMIPYLVERGLSLAHSYQPVTRDLVDAANLVLVPHEDIRSARSNALRVQFPDAHEKFVLLSELVGQVKGSRFLPIDVPDFGEYADPIKDPPIHREALRLICGYLDLGFPEICQRLGLALELHAS